MSLKHSQSLWQVEDLGTEQRICVTYGVVTLEAVGHSEGVTPLVDVKLKNNAMRNQSQLEHTDKHVGSSAHMITTARIPADKPVRIAFSLNDSPDDTPPENTFPLAFPELEQQLQPLPPCHDSKESMEVFKQHCQIAEEYHEVKKEIALLEERKKELIARLEQAEEESMDAAQLAKEYAELTEENRTLKLAQMQCAEQLEKLRIQYQKRQGSS